MRAHLQPWQADTKKRSWRFASMGMAAPVASGILKFVRFTTHSIMIQTSSIEPLESRIVPATMLGLTENNTLLRFDTATPSVIDATTAVVGLGDSETLVAMDLERQSGVLYGLTIDSLSQGRIYRLNAGTGEATFVSLLQSDPSDNGTFTGLTGNHFSFEFSAAAPWLSRIVSDAGQNLRIDTVGAGKVLTDKAPHYASGDSNSGTSLVLSGVAYSYSSPDSLFGIDTETDRLVFSIRSAQINGGEFTTIGSLGVDASGHVGMDLQAGFHILFASLQVNGATNLYRVDMSGDTSVAKVGSIGTGTVPIRDIAVVQSVWTGMGGDNRWSNGENWASGLAPGPESMIVMDSGAGKLKTVNDLTPWMRIDGLTLRGEHKISGNPITMGFGVSAYGNAIIDLDIRLTPGGSTQPAVNFDAVNASSQLQLVGNVDLNRNQLHTRGNGAMTIEGAVTGGGNLDFGSGTNFLIGTRSRDGVLRVSNGLLSITGDYSGPEIAVSGNGAFVGGTAVGSIRSIFQGVVAPGGTQLGTIAVTEVDLHETSRLEFQLDGSGYLPLSDRIVANGSISLRGDLQLSDIADSKPGTQFTIVENNGTGPIHAGFDGLGERQIITGTYHRYWISYEGGDGNDVVLTQLPEVTITADGRTASFTDVDGDLVKVTVSKGTLVQGNFVLIPRVGQMGNELVEVNLGALPDGANLRISATPQDSDSDGKADGDGYVNVGSINASGVSLSSITIDGNLGQINAGKEGKTVGVKSLSVHSLGALDLFEWDITDRYVSTIHGNLSKLSVASNISGSFLKVNGDIGKVTIGGSITGGDLENSGKIAATGKIASLKLSGSLEGGSGARSGMIAADGEIGQLTIGGSIYGGVATHSGSVSAGEIHSISIAHDLRGGSGVRSGAVVVDSDLAAAIVKGSMPGGEGNESGSIVVLGTAGRVTVGGSMLLGKDGENSGSLVVAADIQSVKVSGSISGNVISRAGELLQLTVSGALTGTEENRSLISASKIGKVSVKGDAQFVDVASDTSIASLSFGAQASNVGIYAAGNLNPTQPKDAVAIANVAVRGSVVDSRIVAGFQFSEGVFSNPDVTIGNVAIGGDFIRSSIAAGIDSANGQFGDVDDRVISDGGDTKLLSRIASVMIKGQAYGSGRGDGIFGITAETLGKVQLGRVNLRLSATQDQFIVGHGNNLSIREVIESPVLISPEV